MPQDIPQYRKDRHREDFNRYMSEVKHYLSQVQHGRRVAGANPSDPRFSQEAESQRIGISPTAQSVFAAPGTIASRREVLRTAPPPAPAPQPVWGFHEPTVKVGEGMDTLVNQISQILADPRNAWIGMGPLAGMTRFGKAFSHGPDMGGFKPTAPSSTPHLENIRDLNQEVAKWGSANPLERTAAQQRYMGYSDHTQKTLDDTWAGRDALRKELQYPSEN